MTLPSVEDVQRRADQFGKLWFDEYAGSGQVAPPPAAFRVHVARFLDPDGIKALFWAPGSFSEDGETVSGRLVAVTSHTVLDASFTGVPPEYYPVNQPPGFAEVMTFQRSEVRSVRWTAPRLARPEGSLDPEEIVVSAPDLDWSLRLPAARVLRGGEGYFTRVLVAFGLEP